MNVPRVVLKFFYCPSSCRCFSIVRFNDLSVRPFRVQRFFKFTMPQALSCPYFLLVRKTYCSWGALLWSQIRDVKKMSEFEITHLDRYSINCEFSMIKPLRLSTSSQTIELIPLNILPLLNRWSFVKLLKNEIFKFSKWQSRILMERTKIGRLLKFWILNWILQVVSLK